MDDEIKWRFPGNGGGQEVGLSDTSSELFKDNIIAGLAREVVQNSIDAKLEGKEYVRVEFDCFDVPRSDIPHISDVENQINNAIKTYPLDKKLCSQLNLMLTSAKQENFHCCRISDFNTTGLTGVYDEQNNQFSGWHYLIKGSGLSNKTSTSGGSKGVGKYAAFANSKFGTVFYSTKNRDGEEGSIGVSRLCSANIPGSPTREKTQGVGYYGSGDENLAIRHQFKLGQDFVRNSTGTDIYIIGFRNTSDWAESIITELLDSFMSTIIFGQLEIKVGKYEINKSNIKDYVYNPLIVDLATANGKKILLQYLLLTVCGDPYVINIDNYGEAYLYFLDCRDEYLDLYTKSYCTMIRYPYMKICEEPIGIRVPFAALCIIGNNKLNEALREIENPQHNNWENKRLDDSPNKKKAIERIRKDLREQITQYVKDKFFISDSNSTNLMGAEDFIPQVDDSGVEDPLAHPTSSSSKMKLSAKPSFAHRSIKIKNIDLDAQFDDPIGNGAIPDLSGDDEDNSIEIVPEGNNESSSDRFNVGDQETQGHGEGDEHMVFRPAEIRSMKYRFACLNRKEGEFAVIFNSDITNSDVTLKLFEVDANNSPDPVSIYEARVNGVNALVDNNSTVHLSINQGQRTIVRVKTNKKELFSAEVKIYENRR